MSWLAGLAGKAEDFLNKVDQTAAIALQNEELLTKKKRSTSYGNFADITSVAEFPISLSKSVSSPVKKPRTPPETSFGKINNSPVNKAKSSQDDDKLLEFLNNPDVEIPKKTLLQLPSKSTEELNVKDNNKSVNNVHVNVELQSDNDENDKETRLDEEKFNNFDGIVDDSLNNGLEMENNLLRNEVSSLNQEMSQLLQRVKITEAELQRTRDKLSSYNKNSTEKEKILQELHNREQDLREALSAKDSQLAVLRVRLQEADGELKNKKEAVTSLENERERVVHDQTNSNGLHSQALQSLRDRLEENENMFIKEKNNYVMLQFESNQRIAKLEDENRILSTNLMEFEQQLQNEKDRYIDLNDQIKSLKSSLDSAQQELLDYKQKAQKILQSKERLIASLKVANNSEIGSQSTGGSLAISVELEEVKQERDMVRDDLIKSSGTIEKLKNEIDELEMQLQNEMTLAQEQMRNLEEQFNSEVKIKEDLIQENTHMKEEIQFMKEELCRQKTMFQSRIADRDNELEKLRKQLTMKVMNNNQTELESRLHTLTESLIYKQTMLETLSTEKNSLVLQLERMEQQIKENQSYMRRGNATALNVDDNQRCMPEFLVESPFDSQVARKVKRAYNSVDKFSVRLGIFLRRYPAARIMIIVYMGLLHLFVMVILLTYSPEIHPV